MTTTFTAKKIIQLRRRASKAAALPEDPPEGWSKSTIDPMAVLTVFKPLRIKEGYILRAYQFREGGNGNGFVWAMPNDAEFPDPWECPRLNDVFLNPPKPLLALDDVMDAIDGDGSPWSYMCASIFGRHISEFGAMWHGCDWGTHGILDIEPWNEPQDSKHGCLSDTSESEWKWIESQPTDWRPRIIDDANGVTVTFLTLSRLGGEAIYQHTDLYEQGSYRFKTDVQRIATGGGGFVF